MLSLLKRRAPPTHHSSYPKEPGLTDLKEPCMQDVEEELKGRCS